MEIYTKGDKARVVETPADRVAAEWDGFKPAVDNAAKVEEQADPVSTPTPEVPPSEPVPADEPKSRFSF